MTKTIYLEKKTELILEDFAAKNKVSISKAINLLVQGIEPKKKETASETLPKPKKKTVETKKETKQNIIDYSGLTLNQIMMLKRKNKA